MSRQAGAYQSVPGSQPQSNPQLQAQQRALPSYKQVSYSPPSTAPSRPGPRALPSDQSHTMSGSFSSGDSGSSQQRRLLPTVGYQSRPAQPGTETTIPSTRANTSTSSQSAAGFKYATGGPNEPLFNDPEDDDDMHDWKKETHSHGISCRGIANVFTLFVLVVGLVALFAGYPIISHFEKGNNQSRTGFNIGGTNGSGQVPDLPLFSLIDKDTPQSALTRTSPADGNSYHLVFSDEFELEGRTFWPGDDPFWEAMDLYYASTGDTEYYSPEAVNTTGGALTITMTQKETHNLNFQSGMLQSWNKFCFQGGYIEFSIRMPGSPSTSGYWPAAWLMGNLGRPGYQGSTDGMWPFSYGSSSCDTGILKGQTFVNGSGPQGAIQSKGTYSVNGQISLLSGMRSSGCTCPGEDHPGPNVNVARSSPELDILEAQIQSRQGVSHGYASQSYQVAPFDENYEWNNLTGSQVYDSDITRINTYKGNVYQEAVSALTQIPDTGYVDSNNAYVTYGVEYHPDWNENGGGSITWYIAGKPTWSITGKALPPDPSMDIGQRIISVEPMSIIMNLGMSPTFQHINFGPGGVEFPATMSVDYVRVYQLDGQTDRISCDPPDHPTAQYISDHPDIYFNPNHTIYRYKWPKNKLTGC